MSEDELDDLLFHSINSKTSRSEIFLKLLPNGHIFVDWSTLPKHRNVRQCVIHYKSLNTNRSHAIRVSRKEQNITLQKIQSGHLYEIHVCTVDRSNKIIASSEYAQIQTKALDEAPILRVTKSTPDFIWLEWEKSNDVQLSDIESYRLIINGETKVVLPSYENKFVINNGELGQRYIFQLEMSSKNGKVIPSLPISVVWPSVTIPEHHVYINACKQLIICWGNSTSINDGNIESYTFHLFNSEKHLLREIGPNAPDCHQIWINDVTKGVYFYVLQIKLTNSKQSLCTQPKKIECGRENRAPILSYTYADSDHREKLISMAYHLINIRDNMKPSYLREHCEKQLEKTLLTFADLPGSLRLNLTIQPKSSNNNSKSYQVMIDNKESNISIPGFVREFPLELAQREKPYELAVLITPDPYQLQSNKILIEASGNLTFFCAHFNQTKSIASCSYLHTFLNEKKSIHQGFLKSPLQLIPFQAYDLNQNKRVDFPLSTKGHRLTIILFYLKQCVPSSKHLDYFDNYASTQHERHHYITINCDPHDIDDLKKFTKNYKNIQCYTDFIKADPENEQHEKEKRLPEILSLDGVPMYFILNFTGRLVWKGRLCIQNQPQYDQSMNHITDEVQQQPCTIKDCILCNYRSMDDTRINSELTIAKKDLESVTQLQSLQLRTQDDGKNRTRRVVSLKRNQ